MVEIILLIILVLVLVSSWLLKRRIDSSNEIVIYEPRSVIGTLIFLTKSAVFRISIIVLTFVVIGIIEYVSYNKLKEDSNNLVIMSINDQDILEAKRILDSLNQASIPVKNQEYLDSIISLKVNELSESLINDLILLHGSNWNYQSYTDKNSHSIISITNLLLNNELVRDELTLRRIHSVRGLNYFIMGVMDSARMEFTKALSVKVTDNIEVAINWNSQDTRFSWKEGQVPLRSDELLLFRAFANYFNEPVGPKQGFCQDVRLAISMRDMESSIQRLNVIYLELSATESLKIAHRSLVRGDPGSYGWLVNPGLSTVVKIEPNIGLDVNLICE